MLDHGGSRRFTVIALCIRVLSDTHHTIGNGNKEADAGTEGVRFKGMVREAAGSMLNEPYMLRAAHRRALCQ